MSESSRTSPSHMARIGIVAVAVLISFMAGAARLIYSSPSAPVIVAGILAAAGFGLASLRRPVWALYAVILFVLLPTGLIPAQVHSVLNRSLTLLALGAWLLQVLTRQERVRISTPALLMLVFFAWAMVTMLWAPRLSLALDDLGKYALRFIVYFLLMANLINTQETLHGLMVTLAIAGWLLVLAGVGTVLTGGYHLGTRFQVLGMNENESGITLLVTATGVLWLASRDPQGRLPRLLPAFLFLALALGLTALSGSRGSAISWVVTLGAFWFWRRTRKWGKLGLVLLLAAILVAPLLFVTTLQRFAVERGDTFLGGREVIWEAAWLLIRDNLWRGVGLGNSSYEVLRYLQYYRSLMGRDAQPIHNPVLVLWAETGIVGLALYLGMLATTVWQFVRLLRAPPPRQTHILAAYSALTASVFAGFMPSWIKGGGIESSFVYFLMLGLLSVPSHLTVGNQEGDLVTVLGASSAPGSAHA